MIRRVLLATGAIALVAGTTVGAGAGVAMASPTPVTLSGSVTCSVIGTIKFGTPLTNGGSGDASVIVKAVLSGCTGAGASSGAVTLNKGHLDVNSGAGTVTADCGPVFNGASLPTLNGQIKWSAAGGSVSPSTVSITTSSLFYDVSGNSIRVGLPTSVTAGSFGSETGTFGGLNSQKSGYKTVSKCGGSGVNGLKFGKSAGVVSGTVTIAGEGS